MQLADGITLEHLKVFLKEAKEQLHLLDDKLISLEKETTEDGLALIFRADQTLKGSSAILGYTIRTEIAWGLFTPLTGRSSCTHR
jgi:chemotaxis protein histidine kinase CheA